MRCVITGCAFVDSQSGDSAWGDLWEVGDCWVFNACMKDGETNWLPSEPPVEIRQVRTMPTYNQTLFERRGVLVISKSNSQLNYAAQEYLAK